MQLLVSVSDVVEAGAALDGGADIIDAKDPGAGPLGPVTLETLAAIRLRTDGSRPLSAALGDPPAEDDAHRLARSFIAAGASVVKVGFHAARDAGDVRRLLAAAIDGAREAVRERHPSAAPSSSEELPRGRGPAAAGTGSMTIAVAYADHAGAGVTPWRLIDIARSAGAEGILLDTADKRGPGLLTLLPPRTLQSWIHEASSAGLLVAIAGRLSGDDVMQLRGSAADIVGVRGAACVGGRTGRVNADNVRRLKAWCGT
jgi:(5-formylfuran-3-yl)methyl phosphate synthase